MLARLFELRIAAKKRETHHACGKELPQLATFDGTVSAADAGNFNAFIRKRRWRANCRAGVTMNQTSKIRRAAALLALSVASGAQAFDAPQSLDAIRRVASEFVKSQIPGEPNTIEISVGNLDERLRLAPCGQPLQASLPVGAAFRERTTVAVTCPAATRWTVYVPVSISTNVSALVLRHAAVRGARIRVEDVEVQTRKVPGTSASYLTNVSELTNRALRRPLPAGSVLTADAFEEMALVKRGQQVTLLAALGGIEVRATGLALADARAASRVRVQNMSSQRVVEGVVESANVIRVTP
jgi:flagellar basal body P-ring formation protein FlgA